MVHQHSLQNVSKSDRYNTKETEWRKFLVYNQEEHEWLNRLEETSLMKKLAVKLQK